MNTIKKIISLVFSGLIGGLVVWLMVGQQNNIAPISCDKNLVTPVNYTPSTLPVDFVAASTVATKAVVHIYAEESESLAAQRRQQNRNQRRPNDPFGDFFNMEDFFGGDLFGRNFYRPKNGTGSGVILSEDGYIVTNNHVVGFADFIEVTLSDGRKLEAKKIGTDPTTDLAVIKIESSDLNTISFANSDHVKVGEWVLAVGNPFDLASTVTAGIVSAKGRDIDLIKADKSIEEFIQTDAAVNPGNSGGALVNTNGELVGINTAIATPTGVYAGYSFAIPANLVNRIISDIIENGNIERTNLGIYINDITKDLQSQLNLSTSSGVYIEEVIKKSAAHYAGLIPGDIIVQIDNTKINQFDDVVAAMKYSKVGDVLKVKIIRDGKTKTLDVRLKKGI